MKNLTYGLLAVMSLGGLSATANAALVLSDNFDSYANQAAFESVWTPAPGGGSGTATSALLSTEQAASIPNSVKTPGTASNNQNRSQQIFTATGFPSQTNAVRFSFDYFDSNGAGNPQRNFANLQAGTAAASGFLVSMGLSNNLLADTNGNHYMARIFGADGGSGANAYFKLNDPGAPLRSTGWHNLEVEISDVDFKFYVDGTLSKTISQDGVTPRSYDRVLLGSGLSNGSVDAFYDNVVVETFVVPEPASLALFGLAGAALLGRRRRA